MHVARGTGELLDASEATVKAAMDDMAKRLQSKPKQADEDDAVESSGRIFYLPAPTHTLTE